MRSFLIFLCAAAACGGDDDGDQAADSDPLDTEIIHAYLP
jgi:hypothetical protein